MLELGSLYDGAGSFSALSNNDKQHADRRAQTRRTATGFIRVQTERMDQQRHLSLPNRPLAISLL